ncbi:MliC family protein [Shewanella fidelis]|uniref:MliC family protein n=1 Tax=Shewanella fidelis TaxID=173509 RepID=A0AAW8NR11_9GAMM|nr:MliC family protein [Shewanella fidelis]MDR8525538.1 MliC family protein [Shewanella fidelis]MDW4813143.1 MliC family protein [Shewanella fidelis]MDW4816977.1 MliC family protein [Shewanella fidelis]MDW4820136.1 MliC family protein [Shewanella fidelis]MDW4825608.1 MliC family protein [Shewanella fidelis]
MQKYIFGGCLVLLAACQTTEPTTETEMDSKVSSPQAVVSPSFDCNKAQGQVETLICNDAELAALDRKMAEIYQQAVVNIPAAEQPKAMQRGWIKGRNDCWKSQDVRQCVLANYQSRMIELQISGGLLQAPVNVVFECGERPSITAAIYTQLDPVTGVFSFAEQQILATNVRSGSGAKYQGRNFEFWEHQGEASVQYLGDSYQCQLKR